MSTWKFLGQCFHSIKKTSINTITKTINYNKCKQETVVFSEKLTTRTTKGIPSFFKAFKTISVHIFEVRHTENSYFKSKPTPSFSGEAYCAQGDMDLTTLTCQLTYCVRPPYTGVGLILGWIRRRKLGRNTNTMIKCDATGWRRSFSSRPGELHIPNLKKGELRNCSRLIQLYP